MVCSSPIKREKHGNQEVIADKGKEINRDSCAEERKELQAGRHCSHNANG